MLPKCLTCGRPKKPIGRDSMDAGLCDQACPGYYQEPFAGHLWPSEEDEEFSITRRRDSVVIVLPIDRVAQITITDTLDGWSVDPVLHLRLSAEETADLLRVLHETACPEEEDA